MTNARQYMDAMISGNTTRCIQIEQKYGLFGYPPELVSVGLKAIDEGKNIDQAIEAYINGQK